MNLYCCRLHMQAQTVCATASAGRTDCPVLNSKPTAWRALRRSRQAFVLASGGAPRLQCQSALLELMRRPGWLFQACWVRREPARPRLSQPAPHRSGTRPGGRQTRASAAQGRQWGNMAGWARPEALCFFGRDTVADAGNAANPGLGEVQCMVQAPGSIRLLATRQ